MTQTPISDSVSVIVKWITEIISPPVILSTILVFSIASIFTQYNTVLIVSGIWISIYGILDYIFRQTKIQLATRSIPLYKPEVVFTNFHDTGTGYFPKVIKQFNYGGFSFNIMGFDQTPLLLVGLSNPLCPKCNGNLLLRNRVLFPFIVSIRFQCNNCGVSHKSKLTREQLIKQVADLHTIKTI